MFRLFWSHDFRKPFKSLYPIVTYFVGLTAKKWFVHFSLTCCVVQYTVSDSLAVACIEIIENSTFQTRLCFLWYILQFLDLSLGSHLLLTVCLQGIPLAPALQTRIFQPEEAEYVKPSCAIYGNMGLL